MLHASVTYTGVGALVGIAVVAAGTPLLLFRRREQQPWDQATGAPPPATPATAATVGD
jgi:hypothetical protein